jgi:hypothetical protein
MTPLKQRHAHRFAALAIVITTAVLGRPTDAADQAAGQIAPGTPVTISVTPASTPSPAASIVLGSRHGHVTPQRSGFTHTGGGNIDVSQPSPDVVVITMTGVAVSGAHPCKDSAASMTCELTQSFEVSFDNPKLKQAKLVLEERVIGLLRSHTAGGGSAGEGPGCATILRGETSVGSLCVPEHSVVCGNSLSINDHEGPIEIPVAAGKYTLVQSFIVTAAHPGTLRPCKAASSEFAPDPALDPLWISYWEPFHGANKKDFGFQISLKVVAESPNSGR